MGFQLRIWIECDQNNVKELSFSIDFWQGVRNLFL